MNKISSFKVFWFIWLTKIFGVKISAKVFKTIYDIKYWFIYEPQIILSRLDRVKMNIQIYILKIKIANRERSIKNEAKKSRYK